MAYVLRLLFAQFGLGFALFERLELEFDDFLAPKKNTQQQTLGILFTKTDPPTGSTCAWGVRTYANVAGVLHEFLFVLGRERQFGLRRQCRRLFAQPQLDHVVTCATRANDRLARRRRAVQTAAAAAAAGGRRWRRRGLGGSAGVRVDAVDQLFGDKNVEDPGVSTCTTTYACTRWVYVCVALQPNLQDADRAMPQHERRAHDAVDVHVFRRVVLAVERAVLHPKSHTVNMARTPSRYRA